MKLPFILIYQHYDGYFATSLPESYTLEEALSVKAGRLKKGHTKIWIAFKDDQSIIDFLEDFEEK